MGITRTEAVQKTLALIVLALVALFAARFRSVTPEKYCLEEGVEADAPVVEMQCLRRLAAGVCNSAKECARFPEHRYTPNIDSLRDIRCAGDPGGSRARDFGTTGCEYVGHQELTADSKQAATGNANRSGER